MKHTARIIYPLGLQGHSPWLAKAARPRDPLQFPTIDSSHLPDVSRYASLSSMLVVVEGGLETVVARAHY